MPKRHDLVLYDALLERKLVQRKELDQMMKDLEVTGETLAQTVVRNRTLPEREVLTLLAEKLKSSFVDLKSIPADKAAIEKVPMKIALYYRFLPLSLKGRTLTIAVSYPLDIKIQDEIRTQIGCDIVTAYACQEEIGEQLKQQYGLAADTLEKIASADMSGVTASADRPNAAVDDIEKLAGAASIVKLVNQIILDAYKRRATDIHIEPYRDGTRFRYRVDGVLIEASVPPEIKNYLSAIISRIKIMSSLNIVERRLPQDGRAVVKVQEHMIDLRVSTIPTPFGESVVIRILPTQMLFSLGKLGLDKQELKILEGLIEKPHGIIFVTGPTGSGKTTTLYTCLNKINTKERKIITIEDPIEYEMAGVTQIQVMPDIGLDFARGLRSILRHDPDVIMVGEVRDLETAEIAIRVALTGHLVFSTLHTNDAVSAITRLVDIGVEPYLVASSVEAFIAQRLVRVICPECRQENTKAPLELKQMIATEMGIRLSEVKIYEGKGCPHCGNTGFFGRAAIYEMLLMDDIMKDMILKKASASQLKRAALARGLRTLRQDGWKKVIVGVTTPEEVIKVASADSSGRVEVETRNPAYITVPQDPESQGSGTDHRAYTRLDNKVNVRYKSFKSDAELTKKGYSLEQLTVTRNISAGGVLFVATEPAAVGQIIEMKVELPDAGKAVDCLARVVRVEESADTRSYDIAVCFLDITSADKARLGTYIEAEISDKT